MSEYMTERDELAELIARRRYAKDARPSVWITGRAALEVADVILSAGYRKATDSLSDRTREIEDRLGAATQGPWEFDGDEINNVPDYESDNPVPWASVLECRVECMSYCYGGSVSMDLTPENRALIESAPADIAYLLAELRKAVGA